MRKRSKTYHVQANIDGMALVDSVISYLAALIPNAEFEKRYDNNIYAISVVQNVNLKPDKKATKAHTNVMCHLISIQLADGLCKTTIQSEVFTLNRQSPKDRLINAILCVGTIGTIFTFPGVAPFLMTGLVSARIVASANSIERRIFRFIKNYIS